MLLPPLPTALLLASLPVAAELPAAFGDLPTRLLERHPELRPLVEKGRPEVAGLTLVSADQGQALVFGFPAKATRRFTFRPVGLDPVRLYEIVPLAPAAAEGLPEGTLSGEELMTAGLTLAFPAAASELALLLRPATATL